MKIKFYRMCNMIVAFLSGSIILFLTVLGAYSTCLFDRKERTYWVSDSPAMNLVFAIGLGLILLAFAKSRIGSSLIKRISREDSFYKKIHVLLLSILFCLCIFHVASTQYSPVDDQAYVLKAASDLRRGDTVDFLFGGYIDCYTAQCGIAFAEYLLSFVFGINNTLAFQLINVCCMVLLFHFLSKLTDLCGLGYCCAIGVDLLSILFLPDILYVSFVYGSVPGFMLAVLSLYEAERFFHNGKFSHALLSALAIAFSIFLKPNYAIFLIGLLIMAILEFVRSGKKMVISLIALSVLFSGVFNIIPRAAIRNISGAELNQGCSTYSWIAMGLQENDSRAPGWYNDYNSKSYRDNNYETAPQKEETITNIQQSIASFISGERDPWRFFLLKIASEWNNPTFSSIFHIQEMKANNNLPEFEKALVSAEGTKNISQYLNLLQFIVLFGAAAFYALNDQPGEDKMRLWEAGLIFLGGFLFFLVWEGKSRYTVPFFILMFPYACGGYLALLKFADNHERKSLKVRGSFLFSVLFVFILVLLLCLNGSWSALRQSDLSYNEALMKQSNSSSPVLPDGKYYLVPCQGKNTLVLACMEYNDTYAPYLTQTATEEDAILTVKTSNGKTLLYLENQELYLEAYKDNVVYGAGNWDGLENWKLEKQQDGSYVIKDSRGWSFTMDPDDGSVYDAEFVGALEQFWRFIPENDLNKEE